MALDLYRRKRKFDLTPEPRGERGRVKGDSFVVQKHAARRLHYDFRLELDGVSKSWAVTKGPSLVPGEKRLAVHTEDHPLDYGGFEGTIPKGQYGGGTVMLWDRGRWIPEGDPHAAYKKGHLTFTLEGEKLKGRWHLVRMRSRKGDKHENWLLIKGEDAEARKSVDPDILDQDTLSVATRRSLEEIAQGKAPKVRSKVKAAAVWNSVARSDPASPPPDPPPRPTAVAPAARVARSARAKRQRQDMGARKAAASAALPDFVPPELAELAASPPEGPNFIHEIKFDGYRMQARLDRGTVILKTRNGLDWTARFRPVAAAVAGLSAATALIDGEIVVEDENGVADFSALQAALKEGRTGAFIYYVFDLLHLDGRDLAGEPLTERKARLAALLATGRGNSVLRMSEHLSERGTVVFEHACRMGLEGIVSKRIDAPYRSGRTRDWLKSKCSARQEFVVGGFTLATGSRRAIGALAVGAFEGGKLRYAGRIGTGYTQEIAEDLWKRLDPLRIERSPFASLPADERRRNVVWVRPELVIEADLRGWTGGGLVRHAVFKGVREDKAPAEVVRETPAVTATAAAGRRAKDPPAGAAKPRQGRAIPATANPTGLNIRFTNPERVYWPDIGLTKQALADYYRAIWEWIAPHVVRRPLALLRCPNGVGSQCFMQKHAHATFDRRRILALNDDGEEIIAIKNLEGLLALVQAGVLEVHVWGSTIDHIDRCDRIVFDLDPGPGVAWTEVIAGAREVRDRLAALGLVSFVKTSGGKGLHIVVPFDGADWTATKGFTKQIALAMSRDAPTKYLAKMTKSARQGRIFIDYLRNGRGATAIAAYSPRARPGAAVATPIDWSELNEKLTPDRYTVLNLQNRLSRLRADPWAEMGNVR
ncbi:MAG: DNA ligase D, partial [Rhodoplanes sp.]